MTFETKATIATFGGKLLKLSHASTSTKTPMSVYVYLPPSVAASYPSSKPAAKVPVLYYLSGLTCTPDNCAEKGFVHAAASRAGLAVVWPDTSPRGAGIAGEDEKGPTRAVIIASAVDSCFCAGADLKERRGFTPEE